MRVENCFVNVKKICYNHYVFNSSQAFLKYILPCKTRSGGNEGQVDSKQPEELASKINKRI